MKRPLKCPDWLRGRNTCGLPHSAGKRLEGEAGHSASCYAEVKNEWSFETTHPLHAYMACTFSKYVFCIHGEKDSNLPRPHHYRSFTITLRHTTLVRTPLDEWSARRIDFYLTTHNIHSRQSSMPLGYIRTCKPSKRAAADPRLWPRGH